MSMNKNIAIALKEASETQYWLMLLTEAEVLPREVTKQLLYDVEELKRILTSILKTTYQKQE